VIFNEQSSDFVRLHASKLYSKPGMHLLITNCNQIVSYSNVLNMS